MRVNDAPRPKIPRNNHSPSLSSISPQAKRKWETTTSLTQLRERILTTVKPKKAKLPWLKLARFGDKKTEKGSLRSNANLLEITGIELDYDQKMLSFGAAVDIIKRNKLRAMLYTSPSHTEAKPKWRVLCPTSKALPPTERERLARGVDALFGIIFSNESFTLSQGHYYGRAADNLDADHKCEVFDGDCVDLMELPAPAASKTNGKGDGRARKDWDELHEDITSGRELHTSLCKLAARYIKKGYTREATERLLYELMDQSQAQHDRPRDWEHRRGQIPGLVESAVANPKFANGGWRGQHKDGTPTPSMHNAMVAITAVGVECSHDTFHNKVLIRYRGHEVELQRMRGEITDGSVIALRHILETQFGTDFHNAPIRDAITCLADQHCFDPVRDMLDAAQAAWDGTARLDTMVSEYANCANTPLNRAIMRKTMIAAVRRARRPGCKFDNITVLESEEGWNKSTFWRVLAGDENFSDESILGKSTREIQEHLSEVWIHESADLADMRKAEVESVKAFASRQVDIARPAYGYFVKKQPRHAINVGTTNSDEYLQSQTGNRRFWPLKVLKRIDIEKLARSRMQLWGEAAKLEADGESITLSQELWGKAADEQEKRRVKDPWEELLADIPETVSIYQHGSSVPDTIKIVHDLTGKEFVSTTDLLAYVLKVPIDRQDRHHAMRLADAMKRHGWARDRATVGGDERRGFARMTDEPDLLANLANLQS